jgi:hypothetical protein
MNPPPVCPANSPPDGRLAGSGKLIADHDPSDQPEQDEHRMAGKYGDYGFSHVVYSFQFLSSVLNAPLQLPHCTCPGPRRMSGPARKVFSQAGHLK